MRVITTNPVINLGLHSYSQASGKRKERKEKRADRKEFADKVGTIGKTATDIIGGLKGIFGNRNQTQQLQQEPVNYTPLLPRPPAQPENQGMSKNMKIGLIAGGIGLTAVLITVIVVMKRRKG